MAATRREPEDKEITLDLNLLWIAQGDGEEVGWCKRGAKIMQEGGRAAMAAFPLQQLID